MSKNNFITSTDGQKRKERSDATFSETFAAVAYDLDGRIRKARTISAVIQNYFAGNTESLSVLDIGCSTGIITNFLAPHFKNITGVDVDKHAIAYAQTTFHEENLSFLVGESWGSMFAAEAFDVVICNHVYEHVADAHMLMKEIYRVLKPRGICYFAAANRLRLIEPHYKLPLLSMMPRPISHIYVRCAGKARYYDEKLASYWRLRDLVKDFRVADYTARLIDEADVYHTAYMVKPRSLKAKAAKLVLDHAYWAFPAYVWLLEKIEPAGQK